MAGGRSRPHVRRGWNPLYNLGALGFFYFWIVAVSGIYAYIFFDTGTTEAFDSVEYLTRDQWYLGGVMRSLHRYASDGMVLMMAVHMLREFALDRYRGTRWFTWVSGVPVALLTIAAGITGYWLVWDHLAQYVAIATTELLDYLPIFGEPIARNFLAAEILDDRFFTLLIFMHIALPLILLGILWLHLQRVSRPRINPARGLAIGTFAMMLALSLAMPAVSQGPADLATVPSGLQIDWFYLFAYPLTDIWSHGTVWSFGASADLMLVLLPWMPPMKRAPAAVVNLDNCNGCKRCADDCPYNAISMDPRSDGLPFAHEAVVDPAVCVSCGICAGACPTSTPFRRATALIPGIDLPHRPLGICGRKLRKRRPGLTGPSRLLLIGLRSWWAACRLRRQGSGRVSLPCTAALPPSFIDYALSRNLADGIVITGCREGNCHNRFGITWMTDRLARRRDPYLRARVAEERLPGGLGRHRGSTTSCP